MNIRSIQARLPWSIAYSAKFVAADIPYKDFEYALVHVTKAAGKLAAFVDDADHDRGMFDRIAIGKYLADLVMCAMRMANTVPGGPIDLEQAVIDRIAEKNGVRLDLAARIIGQFKTPGRVDPEDWNSNPHLYGGTEQAR